MKQLRRGPFVPRRQRTPRKPVKVPFRLLGIVLGVLVVTFAIGYVIAVRVLFPPLPEPENGIPVPRLIGMSIAEAENQLRGLQLRLVDISDVAHPSQPAGTIVAQNPLAGQQLRELGEVRVAVSAGPPRVPVPNVVGYTAERAISVLAAIGFETDRQIVDSGEPAGTVVRVLPSAGTDLAVPGRVVLVVSAGPPAVVPADTAPAADSIATFQP